MIYVLILTSIPVSSGELQLRTLPDELLVRFNDGVSQDASEEIVRKHNGRTIRKWRGQNHSRVKLPPGRMAIVKAELERDPQIRYVEPNYLREPHLTPNDAYFSSEWHHAKILSPAGWEIATGRESVVIAVLDTGVDPSHPDLSGKLASGYNLVTNSSNTYDLYGHGTRVAGAAAAISNNGIGVTGVAWGNRILPLVIADATGYATDFDLAEAIVYAADHGVKVINISFGGPDQSNTLQEAIDYAWSRGAIIVASAGNSGTTAPSYPAACNNVLAVAATDQNDNRAYFSQYGSWIDVSAPGVSIYTTTTGGGYASVNGTSYSAPITAGLAALVLSVNPSLTNRQVVETILGNTDSLTISGMGRGRINLHRALAAARDSLRKPGDCDNNGSVSIAEVQSAANSYLGLATASICVDIDGDGVVSIMEIQKVINGYLGL